ncbi:hypothetical protein D3A96_05300 [Robertkochia marina]|nr:hypothetical protein D3A96_05300 [Robertkochia marina]
MIGFSSNVCNLKFRKIFYDPIFDKTTNKFSKTALLIIFVSAILYLRVIDRFKAFFGELFQFKKYAFTLLP